MKKTLVLQGKQRFPGPMFYKKCIMWALCGEQWTPPILKWMQRQFRWQRLKFNSLKGQGYDIKTQFNRISTNSVESYKELAKWSLSSNFPGTCAIKVHTFLEELLTSLNQGQTVTGLAGGERNADWGREPSLPRSSIAPPSLLISPHLITWRRHG